MIVQTHFFPPYPATSLHHPTLSLSLSLSLSMATVPSTHVPQFFTPESLNQNPVDFGLHQSSCCLENAPKAALSNNEPSLTCKHSSDSSSVVDKPEIGDQFAHNLVSMTKKRTNSDGYSTSSVQSMVIELRFFRKHKN